MTWRLSIFFNFYVRLSFNEFDIPVDCKHLYFNKTNLDREGTSSSIAGPCVQQPGHVFGRCRVDPPGKKPVFEEIPYVPIYVTLF